MGAVKGKGGCRRVYVQCMVYIYKKICVCDREMCNKYTEKNKNKTLTLDYFSIVTD